MKLSSTHRPRCQRVGGAHVRNNNSNNIKSVLKTNICNCHYFNAAPMPLWRFCSAPSGLRLTQWLFCCRVSACHVKVLCWESAKLVGCRLLAACLADWQTRRMPIRPERPVTGTVTARTLPQGCCCCGKLELPLLWFASFLISLRTIFHFTENASTRTSSAQRSWSHAFSAFMSASTK